MINKAIIFATKAHAGQFRKASDKPYILHPLECAVITSAMTSDQEMIAAALLHDTVEDCGVTVEQLKDEFSERVAMLVAKESEDKTKTWLERKQTTINRLKDASKEECILVLADKLSNLRSIARDYPVFGEELWNRFHAKNKERIGWYYCSVGKELGCLKEFEEYHEYMALLEQVFS